MCSYTSCSCAKIFSTPHSPFSTSPQTHKHATGHHFWLFNIFTETGTKECLHRLYSHKGTLYLLPERVVREDTSGLSPQGLIIQLLWSQWIWTTHNLRCYFNFIEYLCLWFDQYISKPLEMYWSINFQQPKKRWMNRIKEDLKEIQATSKDALDRTKWRRLCQKADPAPKQEKR